MRVSHHFSSCTFQLDLFEFNLMSVKHFVVFWTIYWVIDKTIWKMFLILMESTIILEKIYCDLHSAREFVRVGFGYVAVLTLFIFGD